MEEKMSDYEKAQHLYEMTTETLVTIPPLEWDEMFSGIHPDDLLLTANRLRELAIRAVRMAAYIDARGGEGGTDKGHITAVKSQNHQAEKIRALLDYQNPKDDMNF